MSRALFEKTGRAVWISHLDLMRLFQRAFKRSGLPLTHTHGFNPRPSVSIALPLSVGVESHCELLDFDLEGQSIPCDEICARLNEGLIDGVQVRKVYDDGQKIKHLSYLDCTVTLEYDDAIPHHAAAQIDELFHQESLIVEKKGKNGVTEQDIAPMIRRLEVQQTDSITLLLTARICCQNPTLNPMQLVAAIERYLPEYRPNFAKCSRIEIYDENQKIFR